MTNPIAKAIAKIGVAMGYGELEDYKGSSVEDMLESFASIAQEKGAPSGGNDFLVPMELNNQMEPVRILIPFSDVRNAVIANKNVYLYASQENGGSSVLMKLPVEGMASFNGETRIFVETVALGSKNILFFISEDGSVIH